MQYNYLIKVTHKTYFVYTSDIFADILPIFFQLPTVKLLKMWTLSLFINSSIDNVLLQTNSDFANGFLNSSTFLNVIW